LEGYEIRFNGGKSSVNIILEDVHPDTFERKGGGRWGYFSFTDRPRLGKFGEVHFVASRVRPDVVAHELAHVALNWFFAREYVVTPRNEERFCLMLDELTRKFWRAYERKK